MTDDCSVEVLGPVYPYDDFVWVRTTGPSPSYADQYIPTADKGPAHGHTTGDANGERTKITTMIMMVLPYVKDIINYYVTIFKRIHNIYVYIYI